MQMFWTGSPAPSVLLRILYSFDIQQKCVSRILNLTKIYCTYKLKTVFWILYIVKFPIIFFSTRLLSFPLCSCLSHFEENREAHGKGILIILWFILSLYRVFFYLFFVVCSVRPRSHLLIIRAEFAELFKKGRFNCSNARKKHSLLLMINLWLNLK